MRKSVTINGKVYTPAELTFNNVCKMEEMGASLTDAKNRSMSLIRAYAALTMMADEEIAGKEFEAHIINGGSIEELAECMTEAIEESGFFSSSPADRGRGNSKGGEQKEIKNYKSLRELIDEEYLPQCLAIGITRAEFGELNIKKLRPYILADDLKFERMNRDAHLQGRYFFDAISIAISNALRSKGEQPINYMDEPYDFKGIRNEQKRKEMEQKNNELAMAQFMAFARGYEEKLEG